MEQRVALYFPHRDIRETSAIKRALLGWDNIEIIVPRTDYNLLSHYEDSLFAEAIELVGQRRIPTPSDFSIVHDEIRNVLESKQFTLDDFFKLDFGLTTNVMESKFSTEIWHLVDSFGLISKEFEPLDFRFRYVPSTLYLMMQSLMAQTLAGESKALFTDQVSAYEAAWSFFGQKIDHTIPLEGEVVVPIALACLNLDGIPLSEIIKFRKREELPGGHSLKALRRNWQSHLAMKSCELTQIVRSPNYNPKDMTEFSRQMEEDLKDDAKFLREELNGALVQSLFSKDLLTPLVFGASAAATLFTATPPELSGAAAIFAVGGVAALRYKYVQQRLDIHKKHPTSYALAIGQPRESRSSGRGD